ncbi:MAG TPA: hypothetical protein V6D20_13420, partial [Candidatus Obscuribacterales bacterium]
VYQGGWNPHGVEGNAGYVSSDGKEEVEDWKCEPGCPVEILDNQSGSLTRGSSGQRNATNGYGGNIAVGSKLTGFGDTGGASRFFYNATSTADLNDYLNALVRSTA